MDLTQFKLPQEWVQMFRAILLIYLFWLLLMAPQRPVITNDLFTKVVFVVALVFSAQSDVLSGLLLLMIYFLSTPAILPLNKPIEGFEDLELDDDLGLGDDLGATEENLGADEDLGENDLGENDLNENNLGEGNLSEDDLDEEDLDMRDDDEEPFEDYKSQEPIPVGYNYEDDIGSVWKD